MKNHWSTGLLALVALVLLVVQIADSEADREARAPP